VAHSAHYRERESISITHIDPSGLY
jgi:hypothetical protein